MVLLVSGRQASRVERLMRSLLDLSLDDAGWTRELSEQLATLLECTSVAVVSVRGGTRSVHGTGTPAVLDEDYSAYAPGRQWHHPGVWRRTAAEHGGVVDVVGMTAPSSLEGGSVSVVCRFARPHAESASQAEELLRLLFPVFEASLRDRPLGFVHRNDRAPSEEASMLSARRMLAALDEPCLCCDVTGRVSWRNAAMERLLLIEPEGELFLQELASGVRSLVLCRPASETMRVRVQTERGRYTMRLVLLSRNAALPGAVAAVVVRWRASAEESARRLGDAYALTARELDVVRLLLDGRANDEIANALNISAHTARHHTQRVLEKLGVHSRAAIARLASLTGHSGEYPVDVAVPRPVSAPLADRGRPDPPPPSSRPAHRESPPVAPA